MNEQQMVEEVVNLLEMALEMEIDEQEEGSDASMDITPDLNEYLTNDKGFVIKYKNGEKFMFTVQKL